jgi:predicted transcriptional regulator
MRYARITWSQFKNIIDLLVEKDYVTVEDQVSGKRRVDKRSKFGYFITSKGTGVVKYYRKMDKLLEEPTRQPI